MLVSFTAVALCGCPSGDSGEAQATRVAAGAELTTATLQIKGMHCDTCKITIETSVGALDGVESVSADWRTGSVTVNYDAAKVGEAEIVAAIERFGYSVEPAGGTPASGDETASDPAASSS